MNSATCTANCSSQVILMKFAIKWAILQTSRLEKSKFQIMQFVATLSQRMVKLCHPFSSFDWRRGHYILSSTLYTCVNQMSGCAIFLLSLLPLTKVISAFLLNINGVKIYVLNQIVLGSVTSFYFDNSWMGGWWVGVACWLLFSTKWFLGEKYRYRACLPTKHTTDNLHLTQNLRYFFLAAIQAQLCWAASLSALFVYLALSSTLSRLCISINFPASAAACLWKTTVATAQLQRTSSMKFFGRWAISIATIHTLVRLRISLRMQSCLDCVLLLHCTYL